MAQPRDQAPTTDRERGGRQWLDLIVAVVVALLAFFLTEGPVALRAPLGLLAVLVVPGYALAAAIFPTDEQVDFLERLALSLGLSLAQVAVLALCLDALPGGLSFTSIRAAVTALAAAALVIAFVRRGRAPPPHARAWGGRSGDGQVLSRPSRAARFTRWIVVANLLVAALAYATVGQRPSYPTEFYVLGPQGRLGGYPREVALGDPVVFRVGVRQADDEVGTYQATVRRGDTILATLGPISLERGGRWEQDVRIRADLPGPSQELTLELKRPGDNRPVRALRLWLDVRDRGAG
ncbi:MAG TPA: DUF1616 domain-containing protein [Chloroflexota bacterium]|jgi:uncharacterized membrane protein|nr:DUF1616 domain-containing protein [Chloroflexota bacterium]